MVRLRPAPVPPIGLDVTSIVLGMIGLLLFLLPVLGIPISTIGVLCGIVGVFATIYSSTISLRECLVGIVLSALALAINIGIQLAASAGSENRQPPPMWQSVPAPPYTAPPAKLT